MSFQTLEAVATRSAVVRVNLLPSEIDDARAARRLKAGLALALVGVLGLAAAAFVVTSGHVTTANEALATEQSRTLELQKAQAPYAEVPQVVAELEAAQKIQADVAAYDLPVYSYLDAIASGAPQDLSLTSVALTITPPTAVAAGATANPLSSVAGVGTVSIAGETTSQNTVADWMDQISAIPAFADVLLGSSTLDPVTGVVTANGTATIADGSQSTTEQ